MFKNQIIEEKINEKTANDSYMKSFVKTVLDKTKNSKQAVSEIKKSVENTVKKKTLGGGDF